MRTRKRRRMALPLVSKPAGAAGAGALACALATGLPAAARATSARRKRGGAVVPAPRPLRDHNARAAALMTTSAWRERASGGAQELLQGSACQASRQHTCCAAAARGRWAAAPSPPVCKGVAFRERRSAERARKRRGAVLHLGKHPVQQASVASKSRAASASWAEPGCARSHSRARGRAS